MINFLYHCRFFLYGIIISAIALGLSFLLTGSVIWWAGIVATMLSYPILSITDKNIVRKRE